jgi:hypothetical protein
MAVSLELHNTGDPSFGAEIQALVEHHLADRPGDWRVSIVGSRESDGWEMKVLGPNGFERSYTLVGTAAQPSIPLACRRWKSLPTACTNPDGNSFYVERDNSQRCECMRLNFTSMWARRTSAAVWRTLSIGLRSCTLRWRSNCPLEPPWRKRNR